MGILAKREDIGQLTVYVQFGGDGEFAYLPEPVTFGYPTCASGNSCVTAVKSFEIQAPEMRLALFTPGETAMIDIWIHLSR